MYEWVDKASCKDQTVVFMRTMQRPVSTETTRKAKGICRWCPVQDECLAYALLHHEPGVWGGTDARERARIRRGMPSVRKIVVRPKNWDA